MAKAKDTKDTQSNLEAELKAQAEKINVLESELAAQVEKNATLEAELAAQVEKNAADLEKEKASTVLGIVAEKTAAPNRVTVSAKDGDYVFLFPKFRFEGESYTSLDAALDNELVDRILATPNQGILTRVY